MKEKDRGIREKKGFLSRNSIFTRIFVSLMILLTVMLIFLLFWVNYIMVRNQRELVAESSLNQVSMAPITVEESLESLSHTMTQMLWSRDFTEYLVLPTKIDKDQITRIVRQLQNAAKGSDLVERVFLYSPLSEYMMTNEKNGIILRSENDVAALEEALNEEKGVTNFDEDEEMSTKTRILRYDKHLYLIQLLDIGQMIGVLGFEINRETLNSLLGNGEADMGEDIYIYDGANESVLEGIVTGEVEDGALTTEENCLTKANYRRKARSTTKGYYLAVSDRTGWKYYLPINRELLSVPLWSTLILWLPAVVILLLFCLIVNFRVMSSVYQPLRHLMDTVSGKETKTTGGKKVYKEFAFLEGAWSDALIENRQLKEALDSISPEILENFLRKLLEGKCFTADYMEHTLEGVGSPFASRGRFMAGACVIANPDNRQVDPAERNLYMVSLQNIIQSALRDHSGVYLIRMNESTLAVVFAYPEETSVVELRRNFMAVRDALMQASKNLPYRVWAEAGGVCQKLSDILSSWQEAVEKAQYQKYMAEEIPEVQDGETQAAGTSERGEEPDLPYFREQIRKIAELAAGNEKAAADVLAARALEEAERRDLAENGFGRNRETFLNEFYEQVIRYPLSEEEMDRISAQRIREEIRENGDSELIHHEIMDVIREILNLVYVYSHKSRYRYVDQTKEYIALNYADSNLSLNDVGERIGISSSYLSELFCEISGEKFSAYLANYRVTKARHLLTATDLTIKEIGFECGFNSSQNFARVFKKITGFTPGQFRENSRREG